METTDKAADAPGEAASSSLSDEPVMVIGPSRGWRLLNIREIWQFREFLLLSVIRDIKVRYTQTIMGPLWAVIHPLIQMVIYSVVFGYFAQMPSNNMPYPLFIYSGLVPWTFVATGLNIAMGSLHGNFTIITKIYFPRLLLPLHAMCIGLLDLVVSFVILLGFSLYFGQGLTWRILLVPVFMVPGFLAAGGIGMLLASLSVEFRDVRYFAPHMTQMLMYLSPLVYPRTVLPEVIRDPAALNPFATTIEGIRWVFASDIPGFALAPLPYVLGSFLVAGVVFMIGALIFRRFEGNLVDVL